MTMEHCCNKKLVLFIILFIIDNINGFTENGPNVCVIEHIPQTSHRIFYDCKNWKPRTVCAEKPILKYDCCDGYFRIEGLPGCSGVNPLKNVLETARQLGARKFVRYIEKSGVSKQFVQDGAITLFAPSDEAMKNIEPNIKRHLESYTISLNNLINYHTVEGRLKSSLFEPDMLVNTKYDGYRLRINKFSSWIDTVNCINLVNKDNEATNGIVHVINSILDPDQAPQRNIADVLLQDGRFITFSRAMENTGISKMLRKSKQPVTILAPTDAVFRNIKSSTLQSILNDDLAGEALIKNHIIPHTLCMRAIIGQHKLKTQSKEKLIFDCDKRGVKLRNTTLLEEFLSGENGIIYVTDQLMLPDRANNLLKLIEQHQLNSFLKLIRFAKIDETFEGPGDYTLFAPSESAMLSNQQKIRELYQNTNKAKQFVLHHVVQGKLKLQEVYDNQVIRTLDEERPVTFHINRKSVGIDGSIIEKSNLEGRNGVLHIINKPLFTGSKTWEDKLRENNTFSVFMESLDRTIFKTRIQTRNFKTIFAPTNEAFLKLGQRQLDFLKRNFTNLSQIVENHLLDKYINSGSLKEGLVYKFQTGVGNLEITKENGLMRVNNTQIAESDLHVRNGVIHVINEVIIDKNQ